MLLVAIWLKVSLPRAGGAASFVIMGRWVAQPMPPPVAVVPVALVAPAAADAPALVNVLAVPPPNAPLQFSQRPWELCSYARATKAISSLKRKAAKAAALSEEASASCCAEAMPPASNSPSVLQRSIGRAKLCKFGRSLCECGAGCAYCASAVEIADGGAREKKCSKQMHVDFECNGLFGSRHGLKQCWYCARGIGKVVYNP